MRTALTTRAPTLRPTWNAVTTAESDTNAWYFYDYAGQDPINNYDLTGNAYATCALQVSTLRCQVILSHAETLGLENATNFVVKQFVDSLVSRGLVKAGIETSSAIINKIIEHFASSAAEDLLGLNSKNPNDPYLHPYSRKGGCFQGDLSFTEVTSGSGYGHIATFRDTGHACNAAARGASP